MFARTQQAQRIIDEDPFTGLDTPTPQGTKPATTEPVDPDHTTTPARTYVVDDEAYEDEQSELERQAAGIKSGEYTGDGRLVADDRYHLEDTVCPICGGPQCFYQECEV